MRTFLYPDQHFTLGLLKRTVDVAATPGCGSARGQQAELLPR